MSTGGSHIDHFGLTPSSFKVGTKDVKIVRVVLMYLFQGGYVLVHLIVCWFAFTISTKQINTSLGIFYWSKA